jgi:hypothetical protein
VSKSRTKPKVFCRLLGVALCYVFALQGFLAAYSAALAVSQVNGTTAGFIICHNAGGDGPATRHVTVEVSDGTTRVTVAKIWSGTKLRPFPITPATRVAPEITPTREMCAPARSPGRQQGVRGSPPPKKQSPANVGLRPMMAQGLGHWLGFEETSL